MGSALQSSSMKVVAALTVLCLLAAPAMSKNLGSINVKDFGEVFVCAPDWAAGAIQMHDNGFTMNGNSRLYFCNRAVDGWDPNAYWQTPLNNKHFAYTLDLSNVRKVVHRLPPKHCRSRSRGRRDEDIILPVV